jgi:flagellar biosynthesis/type III secretory pathway ATPase
LAQQAHFPAIDVLASISRLMTDLAPQNHLVAANTIKQLLAAYQQSEDLISIGAYQAGTNPLVDAAIHLRPQILQFLQQQVTERSTLADAQSALIQLAQQRNIKPSDNSDASARHR